MPISHTKEALGILSNRPNSTQIVSIYPVSLTSHPFSVYYIREGIIDNILKG